MRHRRGLDCSGVTVKLFRGENMRIREFSSELWLPPPPEHIFSFFSNAENLNVLTPPWLHFKIITPLPISMREGIFIDYRLSIRGIRLHWRTQIKVWQPPERFIDEQMRGPYRMWIHEHTFIVRDGGTLVRDRVRYAIPFDFLLHRWFVQPDIQRIFDFRKKALQEIFAS